MLVNISRCLIFKGMNMRGKMRNQIINKAKPILLSIGNIYSKLSAPKSFTTLEIGYIKTLYIRSVKILSYFSLVPGTYLPTFKLLRYICTYSAVVLRDLNKYNKKIAINFLEVRL